MSNNLIRFPIEINFDIVSSSIEISESGIDLRCDSSQNVLSKANLNPPSAVQLNWLTGAEIGSNPISDGFVVHHCFGAGPAWRKG